MTVALVYTVAFLKFRKNYGLLYRLKNIQKKPFATNYKSKHNFKSHCIPLTLFNFYIHLTNQLNVPRQRLIFFYLFKSYTCRIY